MSNNYILKSIRISEQMNKMIEEACKELGLKKQDLVRFLLNRALMQLNNDARDAGGYDNLEITLRKIGNKK